MVWYSVHIWLLQLFGYALFLLLLWPLGNEITKVVLQEGGIRKIPTSSSTDAAADPIAAAAEAVPTITAGRYIGALERTLILIGIVVRSWEIVAAVVALKSVARYKELDTKLTAEYFLVGSLVSIIWAVAVSIALVWYDENAGWHLVEWMVARFTRL